MSCLNVVSTAPITHTVYDVFTCLVHQYPVYTIQPVVKPVTTGLITVLNEQLLFVQPVVKPVWQQVVSCKRGLCLTNSKLNMYTATTVYRNWETTKPRIRNFGAIITSAKDICNRRLSVCLFATLRKNFRTHLHEIFREGWHGPMNKWLNFGGDPDHGSG